MGTESLQFESEKDTLMQGLSDTGMLQLPMAGPYPIGEVMDTPHFSPISNEGTPVLDEGQKEGPDGITITSITLVSDVAVPEYSASAGATPPLDTPLPRKVEVNLFPPQGFTHTTTDLNKSDFAFIQQQLLCIEEAKVDREKLANQMQQRTNYMHSVGQVVMEGLEALKRAV